MTFVKVTYRTLLSFAFIYCPPTFTPSRIKTDHHPTTHLSVNTHLYKHVRNSRWLATHGVESWCYRQPTQPHPGHSNRPFTLCIKSIICNLSWRQHNIRLCQVVCLKWWHLIPCSLSCKSPFNHFVHKRLGLEAQTLIFASFCIFMRHFRRSLDIFHSQEVSVTHIGVH